MWNGLEIAKLIASLTTPLVVALVGFWLNKSLKKQERRFQQEDEARRDEVKRQDKELERQERDRQERLQTATDELHRRNSPHIELALDCTYHGIRGHSRLTTFTVSAKNVGLVRHEIDRINLRVRAIDDEAFETRKETAKYLDRGKRRPRVLFPHEVLKTNLVPPQWNYVFIEPGVTQVLSFTQAISVDHRYLLAHVIFEYKEYEPHSAEAVFAVPSEVSG